VFYSRNAITPAEGMAGNFTNGKSAGQDDRKIFIGGLTRNMSEKEVRDYFKTFGEVVMVDIKMDPVTQQTRGFGFVQFIAPKTADVVLSQNDHYIGNKKIDVKRVAKKVNPLKSRIFIGGLTQDITEADIRTYFSQYGHITEFQQPFDKTKNIRKGYCFLTFDDAEHVNLALANPKQVIKGKEVDVKKVKFNPETMGGGPSGRPAPRVGAVGGPGSGPSFFSTPRTAYPGFGGHFAQTYNYPTTSYEAYGPAYAGYDYSTLGYADVTYGSQSAGGGKFRDPGFQRPAPY